MNTILASTPPTVRLDPNLTWLQQLTTVVFDTLRHARGFDFYPRAHVGEESNIVDVRIDNPVTSTVGLQVRYTASPEHESRVINSRNETRIFLEARCISGDHRHEESCSFDWQHTGMDKSIERAVGIMMDFFKDPIHKDPLRP